jgi:flavorubredoxin
MFHNRQITQDIYYVGVNDRQKAKFENLIPLYNGVSYNAYLVLDEKTALIDTVDIHFGEILVEKIQSQLQGRDLDYLIINHMEPDHSGSIRLLRKYFPNLVIVGNERTLDMVEGFYGIGGATLKIQDEQILSLGRHQLQFFLTPMVHWPETMMTFDANERILFSGDAFGCFGALNGGVMDTELELDRYWEEMYRYYANIIGKYGSPVQKAIQKLSSVPFEIICSTHGPVWKEYRQKAVDIYDRLSRFEAEEGVVIVYGSMYGTTELMAETIAQGLSEAGVKPVIVHNVSNQDLSVILSDIYKYRGCIMGSPTYNNGLFPEMEDLIKKIESRGVKNRIFGCFGSYSWSGASVKNLSEFAHHMNWQVVEQTVEEKQGLKKENYELCLKLGHQVASLLLDTRQKNN